MPWGSGRDFGVPGGVAILTRALPGVIPGPAHGRLSEWPMEADCKSVGLSLRRFESCTCHHCDVSRVSEVRTIGFGLLAVLVLVVARGVERSGSRRISPRWVRPVPMKCRMAARRRVVLPSSTVSPRTRAWSVRGFTGRWARGGRCSPRRVRPQPDSGPAPWRRCRSARLRHRWVTVVGGCRPCLRHHSPMSSDSTLLLPQPRCLRTSGTPEPSGFGGVPFWGWLRWVVPRGEPAEGGPVRLGTSEK
jgi:hypothetical protein